SALASVVLPTPGASSRRMCPSARSATSTRSRTCGLPTNTRFTLSRSAPIVAIASAAPLVPVVPTAAPFSATAFNRCCSWFPRVAFTLCAAKSGARVSSALLEVEVERQVERRRAVRDPADRDPVDAGVGDPLDRLERHAARGLELGALLRRRLGADLLDRVGHGLARHVVEEDQVRPVLGREERARDGVDLDLDRRPLGRLAPRVLEGARDPAGLAAE